MRTAQRRVSSARQCLRQRSRWRRLCLFWAEQDLLLVRLAVNSAARIGELAALRIDDLDDRVLTLARAAKGSIIGLTKDYRVTRVTIGSVTAACWARYITDWPPPRTPKAGSAWCA